MIKFCIYINMQVLKISENNGIKCIKESRLLLYNEYAAGWIAKFENRFQA